MMFWLIAAGILVLVTGRLMWRSLRPETLSTDTGAADYLRSQTALIARDAQIDGFSAEHRAALEADAGRAALADAAHRTVAEAPSTRAERWLATAVIMVVLPAIAIPVYLHLGSPRAVAPESTSRAHLTPPEMLVELKKRIASDPTAPEPRLWLARVYMSMGQYQEAVATFAELEQLAPNEPAVLVQYADALAMTQNGKLQGKASELIQRALKLDPRNVTALWLAGLAADEAGESQRALELLRRAKAASAGTELPTEELDTLITDIEARSGGAVALPPREPAMLSSSAKIVVDVQVDAKRRSQYPATSVVFVLARAPSGPPLPLAVKRMTLTELPARVVLDDTLSMAPQFKLSGAAQVNVVARISRSGNPIATSGDLEGTTGPITVGPEATATVVIKDVVP
jgi:cytochrome c-type biogenesis protein CcmH